MQVQIVSRTIELLEEADQVLQGSAEAVNRPSGNDVDLAAHDRL